MAQRISKEDFWSAARLMIGSYPHSARHLAEEYAEGKNKKGIHAKIIYYYAYHRIMKAGQTFNMACMTGAAFGHKHEPKDLLLGLAGLKKLEAR